MTTNATARRTFYVHHAVHVAVAGAENSLCGVRLIGAIDTTADVTCDRCATHRFETTPGLWAKVAPIGDGELGEIGGLPESTAGFPTEAFDEAAPAPVAEPDTTTARLTIPARELRRADRVANLAPGMTVTAFDVDLDGSAVDVFPTAGDLDAGAARRYTIAAGELVVVDREVHLDGRPVRAAAMPAPARAVAEVRVRGRRYTASREGVGPAQRTEAGQRVAIIVRNSRGADVGTVFVPSGPAYRRASAIVVGCPTSWTASDSRHAAAAILEQLGEA